MIDTEYEANLDRVGGVRHDTAGRTIHVDDDHVLSMDDVTDVDYDGNVGEEGDFVTFFTETHAWQFAHGTQYVTIIPLDELMTDDIPSMEQLPMTRRTRKDLAHAVPLV